MHSLIEYSSKDHWVCRVDARVKIIVTFALLIMSLTHNGLMFPLILFSLCVVVSLRMKIPFRTFILRFSEPVFIASVIVLIKLYSVHVSGYRDGLMDGLAVGGRIIGAVSVIVSLGFTTQFTDLMSALSWFRVPKSFIEITMFALRYIFVLMEDAMVIYSAQKNRLGYSSTKRGLKSFGTLAGSLTMKAFEHSQNLTTAMVQRGYDGHIPVANILPLKNSDIIVSFLFLLVMGIAWRF
ncbi:cobalt ECF transporter T component CbiQ [Candidatus Magnetomonas plexicatena]|uniref:cobalt ECF transporter T component CbiQ n=1 Tax=Candidatus Magnetomonas plexicatena TaxID=2552947 RepID=UPI00110122B4|nr:cobalt ECF transporter T component CbiQ [Nitrospirales bacterium LBB_01]